VGKATGSREGAPDDRLRVPTDQDDALDWMTFVEKWWARRKRAFAHPAKLPRNGPKSAFPAAFSRPPALYFHTRSGFTAPLLVSH